MAQWFQTKAGALVNADEIAAVFTQDGKVWATLKRDGEDDVQLAVGSMMDLCVALLKGKVVV